MRKHLPLAAKTQTSTQRALAAILPTQRGFADLQLFVGQAKARSSDVELQRLFLTRRPHRHAQRASFECAGEREMPFARRGAVVAAEMQTCLLDLPAVLRVGKAFRVETIHLGRLRDVLAQPARKRVFIGRARFRPGGFRTRRMLGDDQRIRSGTLEAPRAAADRTEIQRCMHAHRLDLQTGGCFDGGLAHPRRIVLPLNVRQSRRAARFGFDHLLQLHAKALAAHKALQITHHQRWHGHYQHDPPDDQQARKPPKPSKRRGTTLDGSAAHGEVQE